MRDAGWKKFSDWYNTQHKHSGLKFVTPEQRHTGEDTVILKRRYQVYQMAKKQRPQRWARQTRNWILPSSVTLNPDRKEKQREIERKIMVVV